MPRLLEPHVLGLWGALFALAYDWLPGGTAWLKGLIYGLMVAVVGSWTLVPLIKGRVFGQADQMLCGGLDPQGMLVTIVVVGGVRPGAWRDPPPA